MKKFFLTLIALLFLIPAAHANRDRGPYLDQQMILLGLYLYGLNQELTHPSIDFDETQYLTESIIDIAQDIQKAKTNQLHHKKTATLLEKAQAVKASVLKRDLKQTRQDILNLKMACANCHRNKEEMK